MRGFRDTRDSQTTSESSEISDTIHRRCRYSTDRGLLTSRTILSMRVPSIIMNNKFVRELLADHSQSPRNYGELPSPDVEAAMTNPQCVGPTHPEGDRVRLQVVLSDDGTTVETVRFTGDGCTLSQAGASLLSEQMIGASVSEVVEWDSEYIEEHVGMDLTPSRLQCAELILTAFRQAIEDGPTNPSS
ncbi:iron-sulfur cluster assembly scaffold protein [Halorubrum sp. BOL3-1]|nr:iron-sulfur cluster assembly scaffold protein [Halorubrum sp. BOL3-1]